MKLSALVLCLLVLPLSSCKKQEGTQLNNITQAEKGNVFEIPYKLSSLQRQALEKVLAEYKGWRIAVPSDNKDISMAEYKKENPDYEPYFVCADMNEDGEEDFAIVLTNSKEFLITWFNGDTKEYKNYQVLETHMIDKESIFARKNGILYGTLYSDYVFMYKWNPDKKMLILSEEDSYDDDVY